MKIKLFLLLCFLSSDSAFAAWTIQTVDATGGEGVGSYSSIAIDANNNPHISYFYSDGYCYFLAYAKWTGSSWSIQTPDSATYVGAYTSIAVDSSDNPHISYYDVANTALKYAKWTGSSWSIQTVDSAGIVGQYTSIALDSGNNPHISYYDATDGDLKYAKWTGSSWSIQTVDSTLDVGAYTSIALDSGNNPHISYYDATNGDLKYAKWIGSSWSIQTVDSGYNVGRYTSIVLDTGNNPHISYYSSGYSSLKYAKWTGSSWSIQTVADERDEGACSSIVLDSSNNPHIAYYYYDGYWSYYLKYAKWTGSSWVIQTVGSAQTAREGTSIALDSRGNPHISYYDSSQGLKYAKVPVTNNNSPTLVWTGEANYFVDGVNPKVGDKNTTFMFRVKYTDADNDAPASGYPKLHGKKAGVEISGSPFSMNLVSGAYNTGAIYSYSKVFASTGTDYSYYFEAQDVFGGVAANFPSVAKTGPEVYKALIYWTGEAGYTADGLSPESADRNASYVFRIKFSDSDNAAPGAGFPKLHIKQSGTEISGSPFTMAYVSGAYTTGAVYFYTKNLSPGMNYSYYFEAQDAVGAAAGGSLTAEVDAPDVTNQLPGLSWTGETNYLNDGVYPKSASSDVISVFRVKYSDADNDAPASGYPKLYIRKGGAQIAGSPFLMNCSGAGYVAGVICDYSQVLGSGDYSYRFEAFDIYNGLATGAPANENGGLVSIGTDLPPAQEVKVYHGVFKPGENEKTNISFNTAAPVTVTVTVYNNTGRKVKELYRGSSSAGLNLIQWDGRDDGGRRVSSGVYTIKIEGGGINQSRRVVVVR